MPRPDQFVPPVVQPADPIPVTAAEEALIDAQRAAQAAVAQARAVLEAQVDPNVQNPTPHDLDNAVAIVLVNS